MAVTCRIQRSLNHEQFEMITNEENKNTHTVSIFGSTRETT